MFLFKSKNQKSVKKWEEDHEQIVMLAHKVFDAYADQNEKKVRLTLKELNKVATSHFMNEDLEFYRMSKDEKRIKGDIKEQIETFRKTFSKTKKDVMNFLTKYSKPDSKIDEEFFDQFNELVEAIGDRIGFEERNLYVILKEK